MPLPPALLARLKKRGLVTPEENAEPEEEVIAESYDDDVPTAGPPDADAPVASAAAGSQVVSSTSGAPGCPNKINPYHRCTLFCWERWGGGISLENVDPDVDRRRRSMLRRYPLPDGWAEVFDPGTGRFYYWNIETDKVSWLAPLHPKAVITLPANQITKVTDPKAAENMSMQEALRKQGLSPLRESDEEDEDEGRGGGGRSSASSDESDSEEEEEEKLRREDRNKRRRLDRRRGRGGRGNAGSDEETLDPMDPAAYSECPRGSWKSGLDRVDEAKTGVDDTAAGPLFQQRPYPSPGDVLRRNRAKQKD